MRSMSLAAACILSTAFAAPAGAQQAPVRPEEAAVTAAVVQLFAAAERKDLAALDSLYAGEQLTVIEGAGINRGWRDYRDRHIGPELEAFSSFKYRPFEIEPHVRGDIAYAIFRYALQATTNERSIDVVGRGTAILERKGSRWIIRHTQTSSRPRRETDPPMPQ